MTYSVRPDRGFRFNAAGGLVVLTGTITVAIGLTVAPWLTDARRRATVSQLLRPFSVLGGSTAPALDVAFFSWLSWALLAVAVTFGILGICPFDSSGSTALRITAFAVGVGAAVLALVAIVTYVAWLAKLVSKLGGKLQGGGNGDAVTFVFHHAGYGLWLTIGGFLLIGVGGTFGPLHRREVF